MNSSSLEGFKQRLSAPPSSSSLHWSVMPAAVTNRPKLYNGSIIKESYFCLCKVSAGCFWWASSSFLGGGLRDSGPFHLVAQSSSLRGFLGHHAQWPHAVRRKEVMHRPCLEEGHVPSTHPPLASTPSYLFVGFGWWPKREGLSLVHNLSGCVPCLSLSRR